VFRYRQYYIVDGVDGGDVAHAELYDAIQSDPQLATEMGLTEQDIQALANGDTQEGFTWHHSEEPGVLQLVDENIHANTGHDGGERNIVNF
jgi:hypothetical protein